jgi:hypothetical protein
VKALQELNDKQEIAKLKGWVQEIRTLLNSPPAEARRILS